MQQLSIYLEDSYSRDIFSFLRNHLNIDSVTDLNSKEIQTLLITPSSSAKKNNQLLNSIQDKMFKKILILDHGHFFFDDYKIFLERNWDLIISSNAIDKKHELLSIYDQKVIDMNINFESLNKIDYLFCSQPLEEDNRSLGFNQNDLIKEISEKLQTNILYIKRHPREALRELELSNIVYINKDINYCFKSFYNWIGFNSIPLISSKNLGFNSLTLKDSKNIEGSILEYLSTQSEIQSLPKSQLSKLLDLLSGL